MIEDTDLPELDSYRRFERRLLSPSTTLRTLRSHTRNELLLFNVVDIRKAFRIFLKSSLKASSWLG